MQLSGFRLNAISYYARKSKITRIVAELTDEFRPCGKDVLSMAKKNDSQVSVVGPPAL